jgi:MFS transporter, DHA1 family, inner membrane transport protein
LDKAKKSSFLRPIFIIALSRFAINLSRRFVYPFAPTIARQLNVPVSSIQSIIGIQSGTGLISPVLGPMTERYGQKRAMISALLIMIPGSILGALNSQFWIFALAMITAGIGKIIFDPAMQSYIGKHVPYNRRGLAIGITELSWAGSLLFIAPVAGFLLENYGLQSVFALLAFAFTIALISLWIQLPADNHAEASSQAITPFQIWRIVKDSPAAMGALGYTIFLVIANEIFFINYGIWMEDSFGLTLTSLGFATMTIAAAEATGEFVVIFFADSLGKRRLTIIGATLSAFGYIIIMLLSFSLTLTLIGIFLLFVFTEIAIVASISLFTETLPDNRSVMMSGNVGAQALGRVIGALLGGLLYGLISNFLIMGIISTGFGIIAILLLWRFVSE